MLQPNEGIVLTLFGKYVGTDRTIEPGNGWSDWNLTWAEYQQGSALAPA